MILIFLYFHKTRVCKIKTLERYVQKRYKRKRKLHFKNIVFLKFNWQLGIFVRLCRHIHWESKHQTSVWILNECLVVKNMVFKSWFEYQTNNQLKIWHFYVDFWCLGHLFFSLRQVRSPLNYGISLMRNN